MARQKDSERSAADVTMYRRAIAGAAVAASETERPPAMGGAVLSDAIEQLNSLVRLEHPRRGGITRGGVGAGDAAVRLVRIADDWDVSPEVRHEIAMNFRRTYAAVSTHLAALLDVLAASSFRWALFGPVFTPEPVTVAVAYHVGTDGFMVAFTFGPVDTGLVDLVAFHVEHVTDAAARVDELVEASAVRALAGDHPPAGLTSRRLRTAAAHQGLLAEARRVVTEVLAETMFDGRSVRRPVRTDARDDRYYASLVLRYAAHAEVGPGARGRLADELGVNENTVRNALSEAKARGLYATSGPGRAGHPTPRAYELLEHP